MRHDSVGLVGGNLAGPCSSLDEFPAKMLGLRFHDDLKGYQAGKPIRQSRSRAVLLPPLPSAQPIGSPNPCWLPRGETGEPMN